MNDWQSMRASDADRERAADVLKAALAEGRLDYDEHRTRLDRLMRSHTYGELQQLVGDLPAGAVPFPLTAPGELMRPTQGAVSPWATPYRPYVHAKRTEGLASASLILGVITPFCWVSSIPAIITGHLALGRIRENGTEGRGQAVGGLILGYLFTTIFFLTAIAGIIGY